MSESNGGAVAGESKIFVDEKSREVLLSFIPAAPLYGNYIYKVNLNQNVLLNLGISSVNLSQALKNGGLFQGEKSVWTFKTAETTRFVLPVLFEYDDTICHCNDASGSAGPDPCKSLSNSRSNRQFTVPGLCYSAEDVNDIVFGNQNHQISGYWSGEGLRRQNNFERLGNCRSIRVYPSHRNRISLQSIRANVTPHSPRIQWTNYSCRASSEVLNSN